MNSDNRSGSPLPENVVPVGFEEPIGRRCPRILARDIYDVQRLLVMFNSDWIFRGQNNSTYELEPNCERGVRAPLIDEQTLEHQRESFEQEKGNIEIFKQHFNKLFPDRLEPVTELGWMALMQHYGLPTRLLDFTTNPYVAMRFAAKPAAKFMSCSIWAVNKNMLGEDRISADANDNEAFICFMEKTIDERLSLFQKWRGKLALLDNLSLHDKSANWRLNAQHGLFIAPVFFSCTCRSVVSELLISRSAMNPVLRTYAASMVELPSCVTKRVVESLLASGKCEIVIPSGLKPLMRELSKTEGVCEESVCPDSEFVDMLSVKTKMKTDKFNVPLSRACPWL